MGVAQFNGDFRLFMRSIGSSSSCACTAEIWPRTAQNDWRDVMRPFAMHSELPRFLVYCFKTIFSIQVHHHYHHHHHHFIRSVTKIQQCKNSNDMSLNQVQLVALIQNICIQCRCASTCPGQRSHAFATCADCVLSVGNLAVMSLPDWCLRLSCRGWIIVTSYSPAFQPRHWRHCRVCSMPPLVWLWTYDPTYNRPSTNCAGYRSTRESPTSCACRSTRRRSGRRRRTSPTC